MTLRNLWIRTATGIVIATASIAPAQDPDFHIYLAFGQSNMEGQAPAEAQDKAPLDRFKVMAAVNCSSPVRTTGHWASAISPLVRCHTNLSPLDHFGRTLVDSLPARITIGVVPVAVAGSRIEGFDSTTAAGYFAAQPDWMRSIVAEYAGNPYLRLVDLAREAKKSGVIKGILLHQGESNVGDPQWARKVKSIYDKLLADLELKAGDVPLLAGEVAPTGNCAAANPMIDALPRTIPTAHVVSAKDLAVSNADGMNVHFDAPSYRELGRRYARTMLSILRDSGHAGVAALRATAISIRQEGPVARIEVGSSAPVSVNARVFDLRGRTLLRMERRLDPATPSVDLDLPGRGCQVLRVEVDGQVATRLLSGSGR